MSYCEKLTRRSFVALTTAGLAATEALAFAKKIPIGLELYSVRNTLQKDLMGTLDGVAKMGYQVVEFYAPYYQWTPEYAKEVRKKLDDLAIKCNSTHNGRNAFGTAGVQKAIDLNGILGARYIVMASAGKVEGADGWKKVADDLNSGNDKMKAAGIHAGYHNHAAEWKKVDEKVPMEIIATNTDKSIMLQLDVGTAVEEGRDPVAWIDANPGRIKSLHLKEWSKTKGYKCLLGEGESPWKKIFQAAEKKGGVEYYLIEQEGSEFPEMETVAKCLATYKKLHV